MLKVGITIGGMEHIDYLHQQYMDYVEIIRDFGSGIK